MWLLKVLLQVRENDCDDRDNEDLNTDNVKKFVVVMMLIKLLKLHDDDHDDELDDADL